MVKIISYVDMSEGKATYNQQQRRQVYPKFREHLITPSTKWINENANFCSQMDEYNYVSKANLIKNIEVKENEIKAIK